MTPVLLASQRAERVQNEKVSKIAKFRDFTCPTQSQQDIPKHTLHNLLNQGQSYSQVSQLVSH